MNAMERRAFFFVVLVGIAWIAAAWAGARS